MKTKRIAFLLATLIAATSCLTACTKDEPKEEPSSVVSTESETSDDGRAMEGNMYVEGLPIVKEKETFTLLCDDGGKAEDKIYYPILEEQTNVHVELQLFPYEIAKEKKNILLNSGNYPDAIGGWLLSEDEILRDGMKEGLYIPINDLIDKYAPKMQEILDFKGVRQTMTLPDGKIYTIPYIIDTPEVNYMPVINGEWLKKLNLEMPTNTDEFADVLRAFKTQDPNGNGKNDEIPFSGDPNNMYFGLLTGWWGASFDKTNFAMVDGKLDFMADNDEFKECIKYFAGLYKEGLIDPELFTHDLAQWKAKGEADLLGCCIAYGAGDFVKKDPEHPYDKTAFDTVPVIHAPGVDKPNYLRGSYKSTIFKTQLAITDKAKNPATIIRWYDNVFEVDNSMQIQNGLFGKRLEKLGENDYRRLDENKLSEGDREKYGWGNMFTQSLPKYCPIGLVIKEPEGIPTPYNEKKVSDELYEPFLNEMPANVWVSEEDSKKTAIIDTDIKNHINKKVAAWVSGQADVEKEWDAYKEELDKLGLQELIEIKVKAQESVAK